MQGSNLASELPFKPSGKDIRLWLSVTCCAPGSKATPPTHTPQDAFGGCCVFDLLLACARVPVPCSHRLTLLD